MQLSTKARRKPMRLGQDAEQDDGDHPTPEDAENGHEPPSIAIRPAAKTRDSVRVKRKSVARGSLLVGGTSMTDEDGESFSVTAFTPKKSSLSKQALGQNTLRKSLAATISGHDSLRRHDEERPSYTADALHELKSSTPSTPKDLRTQSDTIATSKVSDLDLAAKFGDGLSSYRNSAIPTTAEIKEKKERRKRLAKEQEFISLNSDGEEEGGGDTRTDSEESNDGRSLLPYAQVKAVRKEETRLVRDDEDFAEGFDDFVEDGRIALGRKAEKAQKAQHAAEMRSMIEDAEGSDSSSEDESEVERKAAYEAAQTRAGMDGIKKEEQGAKPRRPRTPPRITPLPTLAGVREKVEAQLARKQYARGLKEGRLSEVRAELADIETRKVEVQRLLNEAGEKLERLRTGASVKPEGTLIEGSENDAVGNDGANGMAQLMMLGNGQQSEMGMAQRGLESLGEY